MSGLRYSTVDEERAARNYNVRVPVNTKMGAFRYCQLACQMDDFCASFSVCSRQANSGSEDDCVLSSVRLTGSRLNKMMLASTKSKQADKFAFSVTSEHESQKLIMYRDSSCSLHTKDFLSEYHSRKSYVSNREEAPQHDGVDNPAKSTDKLHLSLEDCAGLSFERNFFKDPAKTEFIYCHLDSHCIVSDDDIQTKLKGASKVCSLYQRHSTRNYRMFAMRHMVATKLNDNDGDNPTSNTTKAKTEIELLLEKLTSSGDTIPSFESKQLARQFWGLTQENCARECNLHTSKCLAFDICRQNGKVLCILYSRRSPLNKQTAHLPLLKEEEENLAKYRVELVESKRCDHYLLKDDYFEVRLKSLLADDRIDSNKERRNALNERENKIVGEDKKQSDEQLATIVTDVQEEANNKKVKNKSQVSAGNQFIHFVSLLIGMFMGAAGFVYRHEISDKFKQVHQVYLARRSGHANDGLDKLVLNNNNDNNEAI